MAIHTGNNGDNNLVGDLLDTNAMAGRGGDDTITGGLLHDRIYGDDGDDVINGLNGDDTINGGSGSDRIDGGSGDDVIRLHTDLDDLAEGFVNAANGETGDDIFVVSIFPDWISGGPGQDAIDFSAITESVTLNLQTGFVSRGAAGDIYTSIEDIFGSPQADSLTGNGRYNEIYGRGGNDVLAGGAGGDLLIGGGGRDRLYYRSSDAGVEVDLLSGHTFGGDAQGDQIGSCEEIFGSRYDDLLQGDHGQNLLNGGQGDDNLVGREGADELVGEQGADRMRGGGGIDVLSGGGGADTLQGDRGADTLTGGSGGDRFVFRETVDSRGDPATRDTITDFDGSEGDVIVLSAIDANTDASGDQDFTFIGSSQLFTGTNGEVIYTPSSDGVGVRADVNGDLITDLSIWLEGVSELDANDFVL